jgi:hypothetical protein
MAHCFSGHYPNGHMETAVGQGRQYTASRSDVQQVFATKSAVLTPRQTHQSGSSGTVSPAGGDLEEAFLLPCGAASPYFRVIGGSTTCGLSTKQYRIGNFSQVR